MSKKTDPDFTPPPQYSQTTSANDAWVSVVTTKIGADGSKSQISHIQPRVKG